MPRSLESLLSLPNWSLITLTANLDENLVSDSLLCLPEHMDGLYKHGTGEKLLNLVHSITHQCHSSLTSLSRYSSGTDLSQLYWKGNRGLILSLCCIRSWFMKTQPFELVSTFQLRLKFHFQWSKLNSFNKRKFKKISPCNNFTGSK